MVSEIDRLIDMLGCGNATPQERIRWAHSIVDLAHAEGVAEGAAVGVSAVRRQLRAASASITKQEGTRSINGVRHYLIPVRAFSVPIASVLAPTKERP